MAYFVVSSATLFAVFYAGYLVEALGGADITPIALGIIVWNATVAIVRAYWVLGLFKSTPTPPWELSSGAVQYRPVGTIYL